MRHLLPYVSEDSGETAAEQEREEEEAAAAAMAAASRELAVVAGSMLGVVPEEEKNAGKEETMAVSDLAVASRPPATTRQSHHGATTDDDAAGENERMEPTPEWRRRSLVDHIKEKPETGKKEEENHEEDERKDEKTVEDEWKQWEEMVEGKEEKENEKRSETDGEMRKPTWRKPVDETEPMNADWRPKMRQQPMKTTTLGKEYQEDNDDDDDKKRKEGKASDAEEKDDEGIGSMRDMPESNRWGHETPKVNKEYDTGRKGQRNPGENEKKRREIRLDEEQEDDKNEEKPKKGKETERASLEKGKRAAAGKCKLCDHCPQCQKERAIKNGSARPCHDKGRVVTDESTRKRSTKKSTTTPTTPHTPPVGSKLAVALKTRLRPKTRKDREKRQKTEEESVEDLIGGPSLPPPPLMHLPFPEDTVVELKHVVENAKPHPVEHAGVRRLPRAHYAIFSDDEDELFSRA